MENKYEIKRSVDMDILQLRYFYEVACSLHVTHSARRLHIAQPSLTQTIHRLERELGVKLFKMQGRNIALTEYGEYLKSEAAPIIEAVDRIPRQLAEMSEQNKNIIKLNVLAASAVTIRALVDFKKQNRDAKIQIIQNREARSSDITITTEYDSSAPKRDRNTYVFEEEILLAVPDSDEFSNVGSISLADVKDRDFISLANSKTLRPMCDRFCLLAGFTPNIVFESDSPFVVRDMIGLSLGVGFWPQYSWGEFSDKHIKLIPINEPDCRREIVIKCDINAHHGNDKIVLELFDFLKNHFERLKK